MRTLNRDGTSAQLADALIECRAERMAKIRPKAKFHNISQTEKKDDAVNVKLLNLVYSAFIYFINNIFLFIYIAIFLLIYIIVLTYYFFMCRLFTSLFLFLLSFSFQFPVFCSYTFCPFNF